MTTRPQAPAPQPDDLEPLVDFEQIYSMLRITTRTGRTYVTDGRIPAPCLRLTRLAYHTTYKSSRRAGVLLAAPTDGFQTLAAVRRLGTRPSASIPVLGCRLASAQRQRLPALLGQFGGQVSRCPARRGA